MSIRDEIDNYAADDDKPILHWLLDRYSMRTKFFFVADVGHRRTGPRSFDTVRVWFPTDEGRILYWFHKGDCGSRPVGIRAEDW